MTRVIHSDLEAYLTGRFRAELTARPEPVTSGVEVDNREPEPEDQFPARLIVVRDDGGPDVSVISGERTVGVGVLCGTYEDAVDLSLIVHAIGRDLAGLEPGNPIAACLESTAPISVPEDQPRHRRYMTFTYSVVGKPL